MSKEGESADDALVNPNPSITDDLQTCVQPTTPPSQTTMYSVLQQFQEAAPQTCQSELLSNQMPVTVFQLDQVQGLAGNKKLSNASQPPSFQAIAQPYCGVPHKIDINKEIHMIVSQNSDSFINVSLETPTQVPATSVPSEESLYKQQPIESSQVDVSDSKNEEQNDTPQNIAIAQPEHFSVNNSQVQPDINRSHPVLVSNSCNLSNNAVIQSQPSNNFSLSDYIPTQNMHAVVQSSGQETEINSSAKIHNSSSTAPCMQHSQSHASQEFSDKFSKIKKRSALCLATDGQSPQKKNKKSPLTEKEIVRKMTDSLCQISIQCYNFDELIRINGSLRFQIDNSAEESFEIQESITKDWEPGFDKTPVDLTDIKEEDSCDLINARKSERRDVSVQTESDGTLFQSIFDLDKTDNCQSLEKRKRKSKAGRKKLKDSKNLGTKEKTVSDGSAYKKARTSHDVGNKKTVAPIVLRTTRSSVWTKLTQKVNEEKSPSTTSSKKKSAGSSESKKKSSKIKKKHKSSKRVRESLPSPEEEQEQEDLPLFTDNEDEPDNADDSARDTITDVEVSPKKSSSSGGRKNKNPQKSTKSVDVHPCPLCGVSFNGADTLEHHLKAHDSTGQYFCSVCKSNLPSQEALLEHLENNHKESVDEEIAAKEVPSEDAEPDKTSDKSEENDKLQLKSSSLSVKNLQSIRRKTKTISTGRTKLRITKKPIKIRNKLTASDLTCEACYKQFTTRKTLRRHLESHRGTKDFACDVCGKCFQRQDYLYHHKKGLHSAEKQFKCDECDISFNFRNSYQLHILKHTGQRPYKCNQCEKTYLRSSHLKEHIQAVHGRIKRFKCEDCGKAFPYSHSLKLHRMLHRGDKPHMCTICGECFVHGNALKYHEESIHGDGKSFQCDLCGKYYKTEHLMKTHRRRHTSDVSRFMCDVCGRQFMFKSNLDAHVNTHNEEKTFVCNICAKTFRTYGTLYTHQNVHKTEKLFTCTDCGKGFKTKESCKAHVKRHTGLKPYDCEICGNCFPDKGGLSKHKRTVHTKMKPYACPVCKKTSARMDNLRVHMRVHEKEGGTSLPIIKTSESGEQELIEPLERKENGGGEPVKRTPVAVSKKAFKENQTIDSNTPNCDVDNTESTSSYEPLVIPTAIPSDTNMNNLSSAVSNSPQINPPQIPERRDFTTPRFYFREMGTTMVPFTSVQPPVPELPNNVGISESREVTSVASMGQLSTITPTQVTGVTVEKPGDLRDFQNLRGQSDVRQTQEYRDMQRMTTTSDVLISSLMSGEFPSYNVTYTYN